jgi:hypothetical protein
MSSKRCGDMMILVGVFITMSADVPAFGISLPGC